MAFAYFPFCTFFSFVYNFFDEASRMRMGIVRLAVPLSSNADEHLSDFERGRLGVRFKNHASL